MDTIAKKWRDAIQEVRRYADYLEGINGHTPRDPGAFCECDKIADDMQKLGEKLDNLAREWADNAGNE